MDSLPVSLQLIILALLILSSAILSMTEASLMSVSKYRLNMRTKKTRGVRLAKFLTQHLEKTLGGLLISNNFINIIIASMSSFLFAQKYGQSNLVMGISSLIVTAVVVIFAEITPKIIGSRHSDRVLIAFSYIVYPLIKLLSPIIWTINFIVMNILVALRIIDRHQDTHKSLEEIKQIIVESSRIISSEQGQMMVNLIDLNNIQMHDIMIPRIQIEYINLSKPLDEVLHQIRTSHHAYCPLCYGSLQNVEGILNIRRFLGMLDHLEEEELTVNTIIHYSQKPYFIPESTPVLQQLAFFKEEGGHFGLIVDEYGEVIGMATIENIVEEVVGEFSTYPSTMAPLSERWDSTGTVTVESSYHLRTLNRLLHIRLPVDGPKTLNGLILEHLRDFPEGEVSVKMSGIILQVKPRKNGHIRFVKLIHYKKPQMTQ